MKPSLTFRLIRIVLALVASSSRLFAGVNYEEPPISYSRTEAVNPVTRLQERIAAGELHWEESDSGDRARRERLRWLLSALQVEESSQVLVFSKTSLQNDKISPATPRAIYFSDEVHLGYVQSGLLELAVADPRLGMAFYTVDPEDPGPPQFVRQSNRCLSCHGAARTRNVPGLMVRSVQVDPHGHPVIAAGSHLTTHSSPLAQRWGGWYVTGTHGEQRHLGNFQLPDDKKPRQITNDSGQNLTGLTDRFDVRPYLTSHSDLVALMVLEHQADGYNLLTRGAFEVRAALHTAQLSLPDREAAGVGNADLLRQTIDRAADSILRHLLFVGETQLTAPVAGTSEFAVDFARRGARDSRGRSLRDFDLRTRLFRHRCSYLIETPLFRALPIQLLAEIKTRLTRILDHEAPAPPFDHLDAAERQTLREILGELWRDTGRQSD